jgi:hypothetical protein
MKSVTGEWCMLLHPAICCPPPSYLVSYPTQLQLHTLTHLCPALLSRPPCSYDISTIASVIPAFASRQDILVLDEGVSYPIQQGAKLSRARVFWFKHNDMASLEALLQRIEDDERRER